MIDKSFLNSKLRAFFISCESEDEPDKIDQIIEETEKIVLAYKEYLLDIVAKELIEDCNRKQLNRRRAFLKRGHKEFGRGRSEILGVAHLGDEVVDSIRGTAIKIC